MAKQYGDWTVDCSLDEGGQASVFLVYRSGEPEGRRFALKRLKNIKRLERFRREVEAAISLRHPNIARYVDHDLDCGKPYLVTDHYGGGSLSRRDLSTWDTTAKLRLFRQIVCAVEHAHEAQIVHRDLKPENIFLTDDGETAVVGDFGICYFLDDGSRVTLTDEAVGARHYTAPELEDGRGHVTPAADIYSLGKILYWMLTGRVFAREKYREWNWSLTGPLVDVAEIELAERELVQELLDRCVAERPQDRFGNGRHLRANLDQTLWRVRHHCHAVSREALKICSFCGLGKYETVSDDDLRQDQRGYDEVERFGIRHVDAAQWLVMWCNHCGHVQFFRRDKLKKDIWA